VRTEGRQGPVAVSSLRPPNMQIRHCVQAGTLTHNAFRIIIYISNNLKIVILCDYGTNRRIVGNVRGDDRPNDWREDGDK